MFIQVRSQDFISGGKGSGGWVITTNLQYSKLKWPPSSTGHAVSYSILMYCIHVHVLYMLSSVRLSSVCL